MWGTGEAESLIHLYAIYHLRTSDFPVPKSPSMSSELSEQHKKTIIRPSSYSIALNASAVKIYSKAEKWVSGNGIISASSWSENLV